MSSIWIVHRDAGARAALTRLAAAPEETLLGAPGDPIFDLATAASAVVLGLSGDELELELEFAHRCVPRLPGCHWIVVSDGLDPAPLRQLFDGVPLTVLRWPPHPDELRAAIGQAALRRPEESLSQRRYRDRLQTRFARWFADLELPQLLRAIDPANSHVPLLIRGELGTGRELAARYVHRFASSVDANGNGCPPGPFISLSCTPTTHERELLEQIEAAISERPERATLWFDELDRLPTTTQRAVQSWIEFGLPRGALLGAEIRCAASVRDGAPYSRPALEPGLLASLGGIALRIPPLRERSDAIEALATDILRSATPEGERVRSIAPSALHVLREHPWPENLREFEAVLLRTLAATDADPIASRHLCFEAVLPEAVTPASDGRSSLDHDSGENGTEDPRGEGAEVADLGEVRSRVHQATGWPEEPIRPRSAEDLHSSDSSDSHGATPSPESQDGGHEADERWIELDEAEDGLSEPLYLDDPDAAVDQTFELARTHAETDERGRSAAPPNPSSYGETQHESALTESAKPRAQQGWTRLVRGLTHELRNPLVSARTLAELLPEHYSDAEFRERMSDLVGADVRRVEALLNRLERIVGSESADPEQVDLSDLFASLLEERREKIQQRRLLVLRELERTQPIALGDPLRLQAALETLLDLALSRVQERGDVYVATHHNPQGLDGRPCVRLLLRFSRSVGGSAAARSAAPLGDLADSSQAMRDASADDNSFDLALAEIAISSMGGRFTLDASRASETVIVADLPAPAGEAGA